MKFSEYSNIFDQLDLKKLEKKFPDLNQKINQLSRIQNHQYQNKKIASMALVHRSALVFWPKDKSGILCNEKLEYLGDSFLNFFIARYSMAILPNFTEGELSKLRASIVKTSNLAEKSRTLNLAECLMSGNTQQINTYLNQNNILSDVFEAVTASLLLDAGFEKTEQWLTQIFHDDVINMSKNLKDSDAKGALQHLTQTKFCTVPRYVITDVTTNKLEPLFEVAVLVHDRELARTIAHTKKAGTKKAAEDALKILESEML